VGPVTGLPLKSSACPISPSYRVELLGLEHGIPSHDTFGEVYAAIDTDQFSDCFSRWGADLASLTEGEVIAIGGKCLRRSVDKASKKAAIFMVGAWAQQNSLVLGQVKVDDKSNEITAIPKLLSRLDIAGGRGDRRCDGLPKEDSRTDQAARWRLCV
jgi:predicted transposase YbfD/YdcC